MTQQIINIGTAPNDGTGDPARNAFDKCNLNFTELYQVSRPTGNAIEFQFNNTTTEPPSVGQIRFNQATQSATTKLWVSHTTSSGVNIKQFLASATTGAKLVVQDKNDNTNYIKFDVTGAPVDKTTYWEFTVAVTASGGNLPNAAILAAVTPSAGASIPHCGRLAFVSATALEFKPNYGYGNLIRINGVNYTIPTAGIAGLANTGVFVNGVAGQNLVAGGTYSVFAFVNSGVITADYITSYSAHSTSTTAGNEGVEIRTGNDTRTLLGIIYTNPSAQFQDTATFRGVLSWFNRHAVGLVGTQTPGTSTASATAVELSTAARIIFLTWGTEAISIGFFGSANCVAIATASPGMMLDGSAVDITGTVSGASHWFTASATYHTTAPEGSHILTPCARTVASMTFTFYLQVTAMTRG